MKKTPRQQQFNKEIVAQTDEETVQGWTRSHRYYHASWTLVMCV